MSEIKNLVAAGDHAAALEAFKLMDVPHHDITALTRAANLMGKLSLTELGLHPMRIAILAASTVDHLVPILRYWLALAGIEAKTWVAPFDTVRASVFDDEGELYAFCPDFVWLFTTGRDLRARVQPGDNVENEVRFAVAETVSLWQRLQSKLNCTILQNNADIPQHDVFGNFAGQVSWSRRNLLRRYNLELADAVISGVILIDFDHIASNFGRRSWSDNRYWYHSKHAISFDMIGPVAFLASRVIAASKGLAKKCLVLDLDNTLWGGVIGDDGLGGIHLGGGADGEAFVDFQLWIKALKERGIILAVCSKNEESSAKEPFEAHPDMQLRLEDISVFRANWDNKAENIREISRILNIGLDSMVFVDDNPAERNLVREMLPMVAVPEIPEDPSGYAAAVEAHCYFETVSYSDEDGDRSRHYRENAIRREMMEQSGNYSSYLVGLDMVATVGDLDAVNLPRMAQLINKSNQFNLTTIRYTEVELQAMVSSGGYVIRFYRLADKFGDNGLISVVIVKIQRDGLAVIDSWVMSCRVLSRTMEEFIALDVLELARSRGCARVVGRYIPTHKNNMVADLYARLGFEQDGTDDGVTSWSRPVDGELPQTFVNKAAMADERGVTNA